MPNIYFLPDQRLVECRPQSTVLDAALASGIDVAHACGGHAQCSTCRMVVVEGAASCSPRTAKEERIAERLGFGPDFRLACQLRLSGPVTLRRLVLDEEDAALADARPAFARRTPPAPMRWLFGGLVRRRALAKPVGDEREVAVLFADLRGFTAFAEALLPYDVIHALELVLGDMTRAVERQGGAVTSYAGDGIMALFGAGAEDTDVRAASRAAVSAGLEIVRRVDARRPGLEDIHGRAPDVGVGIHRGPAIVGAVCGLEQVTAIGDTVNVASRIEAANKDHGTRMLVSDVVHDDVRDGVVVGRSACCSLPGKMGEHTLYEVLSLVEHDGADGRSG